MDGGGDGTALERRSKITRIARLLEQEFEGYGFALMVFDKAPRDGRVSYASNCDRAAILEAMRHFIAAHSASAATLQAADRQTLADLARRALARPVDRRLLEHPAGGEEAGRIPTDLRATVAGLVVAFSIEATSPSGEPVRHLSVGAPDGAAPDPDLLQAVAREFGMEGCRFQASPPQVGDQALHAFRPLREGSATVLADATPPAPTRWRH